MVQTNHHPQTLAKVTQKTRCRPLISVGRNGAKHSTIRMHSTSPLRQELMPSYPRLAQYGPPPCEKRTGVHPKSGQYNVTITNWHKTQMFPTHLRTKDRAWLRLTAFLAQVYSKAQITQLKPEGAAYQLHVRVE